MKDSSFQCYLFVDKVIAELEKHLCADLSESFTFTITRFVPHYLTKKASSDLYTVIIIRYVCYVRVLNVGLGMRKECKVYHCLTECIIRKAICFIAEVLGLRLYSCIYLYEIKTCSSSLLISCTRMKS